MRILQINTEKTWRGGERQTLYTLLGLRDSGHQPALLCRAGTPLEQRARDEGFEVFAFPGQVGPALFLAFRGKGFDILHAQSGKAQSLAVLTKPFHRTPILYTRRVNFPQSDPFSRLKYAATDRVVAISNAIRDTLKASTGKPVDVISSAVQKKELNPDHANQLREQVEITGKKVIATTGDLVGQKDPVTMVETIRLLAEKRSDFLFLHFGNMGEGFQDRIPAMIRDYSLENTYLLMGHHDGVEDYFSLFDVYLVTGNHTEGLNSSVYDAFVYGVPVVSTLTGGMADSVADRGLTCPEGDAACLAEKLHMILDSSNLREEFTQKAERWVNDNVSIPAIGQQYERVYRELLKR